MSHDSSPSIEHISTDCETEREHYLLELASPDDLPCPFNTPNKCFTVLLVWDATDVAVDTICRFARHLIDAGCDYFCTWGPDCERVHDIIDEEEAGDGIIPATDSFLMTTWHDDDLLTDAIEFARYDAVRDFDECRCVIVICIDSPQSASEVRLAFAEERVVQRRKGIFDFITTYFHGR